MVSELGYLVVGTTDLGAWRKFAERVIGAMVVDGPQGGLYIKIDQWQHRILVVENDREQLLASAWSARDEQNYVKIRERFETAGIAFEDLGKDALALRDVAAAFSFDDPGGNRHEIFWGRAADGERFISPVGVERFVTGDLGLGHVVLPTGQDFDGCVKFWKDVMGVGLSDFALRRTGNGDEERRVHFYHLPNARQHSIAFAEVDVPQKLLHFMFEVETLDEVGHAIDRCHREGAFIARTLGRHVNDGVVSIYIDTPSGFHIEFGYDGLEMNWDKHEPYKAVKGSYWGHEWADRGRRS